MINFLTIQNTYHEVQICLSQNNQILDQTKASKIEASKMLAPLIGALLEKNDKNFSALKFIAANYGPGPFTTLRTVLATVNGLSFAAHLPLIGINALDALLYEHPQVDGIPVVVLLNAFNQDVYFAIKDGDKVQQGCKKAQLLITELAEQFEKTPLRFVGNGTELHKEFILNTFGPQALIHEPIAESPSIKTIAQMALEKWEREEGISDQLLPVYLK